MSKSAAIADTQPVLLQEARALFKDVSSAKTIALAVSGGPDSVALLWLAARWRAARKAGPALIAFTVDHGLRPEASAEARAVARLARQLGIPHRALKWRGPKPKTGVQAAAREARYRLMIAAARRAGATHLLTAHTRDDQAETILYRLAHGSGLTGLAGMARLSEREGIVLVRPLLDIPKARLVATLARAKISFATDPSNQDPRFTRVRWRSLMPSLAAEGLDAATLARFAARVARADAALRAAVDHAGSELVRDEGRSASRVDAATFKVLPDEIALRLLGRLIDRWGGEGSVELGKLEAKFAAIKAVLTGADTKRAFRPLTFTLAGALIRCAGGMISVSRAPARRFRPSA